MLLEIKTIQRRLDERFLSLEPMITGMRLVTKGDQKHALVECERHLGISFPLSFAGLTTQFDFGNLTIGPVAFGYGGDYFAWLVDTNQRRSPDDPAWWPGEHRPEGYVMVASGDPVAILLDTKSERILSFSRWSGVEIDSFVIADRFDFFVRGIGTAMLERNPDGGNENLARDIALSVGVNSNNRFWLSLTN
jgi:hypothetical protein